MHQKIEFINREKDQEDLVYTYKVEGFDSLEEIYDWYGRIVAAGIPESSFCQIIVIDGEKGESKGIDDPYKYEIVPQELISWLKEEEPILIMVGAAFHRKGQAMTLEIENKDPIQGLLSITVLEKDEKLVDRIERRIKKRYGDVFI